MKKPILILEQQSWRGGAQRVLEMVLDALQNEFQPVVAFPQPGPFCEKLRSRGVDTLIYPLGTYRSGRKSLIDMASFGARSLYCGLQLASTIAERDIQLVYMNGPRCLPAGTLAARLTARPSLFHLHNTLSRRPDVILASRVARHVSKIVTCSQATAGCLLASCPELASKTHVLYNPVDELSDAPLGPSPGPAHHAPPGEVVVGMVGRLTEAKGHQILLRAIAGLRFRIKKDFQVVFVGAPAPDCPEDYSYARYLESCASGLGLAGKILWTGYQSNPSSHYATMHVLVHPSSSNEGMPLVVLEAMQQAIPVIASRIGGIPEVVRDGVNGLLIPPGDESALSEALERLVSDPALRLRLGGAAHESIDDRFSPKIFRRSIREFVAELCSSPPALSTTPNWQEIAG